MSSEPGSTAHAFWRTAGVSIAVLVLVVVGLTTANARQGPQLVSAEVNEATAVQRPNQRLVLRADQPVEVIADQVSITPAVGLQVSADRSAITVRFDAMLHYATTYEVAVPVRSAATGAVSTLRHTLRTPPAELYVLQRVGTGANTGPEDEIVRATVGENGRTVVHRGPRLQEFAVAEPALAVVSQVDDEVATLTVGPVDGSAPPVIVGENARFTQLKSAGPGGRFGFVRSPVGTTGDLTPQLELYDPVTKELVKVKGFDGGPLTPEDWAFVPGSKSIVAQVEDSSFYLIDPTGRAPALPLAGHIKMNGFLAGTATLVVEDPGHYTAIDLTTGASSVLPSPELPPSDSLYELRSLPGDKRSVGLLVRLNDTALEYEIVDVEGTEARPLFTPEPKGTWISAICVSPNGDYLAAETAPRETESDHYPNSPSYRDAKTVVVALDSGAVAAEVPGFRTSWC